MSIWKISLTACACFSLLIGASGIGELSDARDRQDQAALERLIKQYEQEAQQNAKSAEANYRLALAYSYGAEVAMEARDKRKAESLAEAGLTPATKALEIDGSKAEYHRLNGELCGQVIPANPLMGALKYGQCARDQIDKAIALDSNLALAYVSRAVGNYYLPSSMGGGADVALKDLDKAISLNPNLAEAYLWEGIALHKQNKDAEARKALERCLQLDPHRLWAQEQLGKLSAK